MTAHRITAEEIARFRKSNASLGCLYENDADDILDALESAYAELDHLRSAPVAVEVPTWSSNAFCAHVGLEGAFIAGDIRVFFAGAKACHGWISKEAHPIPSDRVLNDGEVAIRADVLSAMEGCIATLRADDELIPSKALAHLDALRSGEAEGRKG